VACYFAQPEVTDRGSLAAVARQPSPLPFLPSLSFLPTAHLPLTREIDLVYSSHSRTLTTGRAAMGTTGS
jgi:hypothetical protein